ncbi:MAG: hypothetical protein R3A10_08140 [Caldilineaceae bacterium]
MSQEELNDYVRSLIDAGITAAHLVAMKDLLEALAVAQVTPENIATLLNRAELSLDVSTAMLAIQAFDAASAQVAADRAAMRETLVSALQQVQTAFVEAGA